MPSAFISGISKIFLGSSALALGAAGIANGFIFGENKQPTTNIRTVSAASPEEEVLHKNNSVENTPAEEQKTEDAKSPEVSVPKVKVQETQTKPECKLYKLWSEYYGTFKKSSKEELKGEVSDHEYKKIEDACEKANGKEIFVSNKNSSGWKYYDSDQNRNGLKDKFTKYLQGTRAR
ncbi:hypothetical protein MHC_03480 [Mycoplasma haemocanis str. Illinois]|uniref:Uncharacterized protein n=1 Tax=Mycoplasma haemocanis (strain Illinois) TaxID=1111676 RepID=H6N7D4_MYCHN|nr:hypothetical protein [Mycoplasma haemocanis]AEW45556.1 hypothetical protein MHC_03480 [Mycoplasma haemocanis str. Illinois]